MADTFKGIITADGKKRQLPYRNVIETPVFDETLSIQGAFADSKVVGDRFKEVNAETDSLKEDLSNKITKFYASSQGETHLADSDNGKIQDMMLYGKSSQDGVPTPENPVEIKSVVNPTVKVCGENLYPGSDLIGLTKTYTTDFIPVILHKGKIYFSFDTSSDTSDGQQYIADYVDVERGKLIRMVDSSKLDNTHLIVNKTEWLLAESQEIDLTTEEITAFKALTTYYPTTNISVNSEQLDGYTIFNYPISMENGWNYVKQQIGDTRDYIYDMDARTQDTDLQAAEAYVNSEYAVALTELEV